MSENKSPIPSRLYNAAKGGHVAGTEDIIDDTSGKTQKTINSETIDAISTEKTRAEGVEDNLNTRLQTVEELAEISIGGGDIGIGTVADFESDDPEDLAKVPTIGAVLGSMDDEPTAGSDNLVKSGGVYEEISQLGKKALKVTEITTTERIFSDAKLLMNNEKFFAVSDDTDIICFNVGTNKIFRVVGQSTNENVICGIIASVSPVSEPWTKIQEGSGQFDIYAQTTANQPIVTITVDKNTEYHCYVYDSWESEISAIKTDVNGLKEKLIVELGNASVERLLEGYRLWLEGDKIFGASSTTDVVIYFVGASKKFRVSGICGISTPECALLSSTSGAISYLKLKDSTGEGAFSIVGETTDNLQYVAITVDKNTANSCIFIDYIDDYLKNTSVRTRIDIKATDTEVEILNKFISAFEVGNCDIYFEQSTYVLSSIYEYMRDTLGWTWTMELPIGNGCRYFFNNSTIISNAPTGEYSDSRNILGCKAGTSNKMSYELYDGILINNGGTYCVHDECSRGTSPYIHKYKNMRMEYNMGAATENLSKCIGGGCGINGEIVIEDCIFINNNTSLSEDVSYHGLINSETPITMNFFVSNSWFNHTFGVRSSLKATDNIIVKYSNCSQGLPDGNDRTFCTLYEFNNETRS